MQPTIEIQQYGDFFEVAYRNGIDPGCLKVYGSAEQIRENVLCWIGKLWIEIHDIECKSPHWQKIFVEKDT